jgi:hypothetical protein
VKIQLSDHDDIDLHVNDIAESYTTGDSSIDIERYIYSLSFKESKVLFFKSLGFKSFEIVKLAELKSINDYYKQCRQLRRKYNSSIQSL